MNYLKKIIIYMIGIFITALGINISKMAGLGISPVSSLPYIIELITGISLGVTSIIVYTGLIFIQALILKKDFKITAFLQLVCTLAFGYFINVTDKSSIFLSWLPENRSYLFNLGLSISSCLILGVGVYLYLYPNFYTLPAEGLMKAIHQGSKGKISISKSKIITDLSLLLIAIILSLLFLDGIKGIREGTLMAALSVGVIIGYCKKFEAYIKIKFF